MLIEVLTGLSFMGVIDDNALSPNDFDIVLFLLVRSLIL